MPALHHDKTRAERAANQQANTKSNNVTDLYPRVKVDAPNGAAAPKAEQPEVSPSDQKSFTARKLAWIERVVRDHSVSPLARLVATLMGLSYLNRTSGDAWPSQGRLAADLGATRQGIQGALNALSRAGYLAVQVSRGRGHTNHYRPILDTENANAGWHIDGLKCQQGAPQNANGGEIKCQPPLAQNPFKRNPYKKNLLKEEYSGAIGSDFSKSAIATDFQAEFEIFRQQYPRREGRLQAEKKYLEIRKSGVSAEVLLAGAVQYAVERAAAEQAGDDPKFTRNPATWLDDRGWLDKPKPPSRPVKQSSADALLAGVQGFINGGGHE